MDVSKNRATQKWMVKKIRKPYEQMDDLGGFPIFLETPIYISLFMEKIIVQPHLALKKLHANLSFESTLHVMCVFLGWIDLSVGMIDSIYGILESLSTH